MKTNLIYQESAILQHLVEKYITENDLVNIQFTTETPPQIYLNLKSIQENYHDFDGLLGEYIPDEKLIKIYIQGIALVNRSLGISMTDLLLLVLIHEIGHYYTHNVKLCNKKILWETSSFQATDPYIHEFFAQLFTYYSVESNESLKISLITLADKQSTPYKTFFYFEDLPKETFDNLILYARGLTEDHLTKESVDYFNNRIAELDLNLIPKFKTLLNSENKKKYSGIIKADEFGLFDD